MFERHFDNALKGKEKIQIFLMSSNKLHTVVFAIDVFVAVVVVVVFVAGFF